MAKLVDQNGRECSRCGTYKPWSGYVKDKHSSTGYSSACYACKREAHAQWVEKNKAYVVEKQAREYAADPEKFRARARRSAAAKRASIGREAYNEAQIAYRLSNYDAYAARRDAYREANADKIKLNGKRHRLENPDLYAAYDAEKRAKRAKRVCAWADLEAIRCVYSMARMWSDMLGIKCHVDHVIPLLGKTVSGLHSESNLMVTPGDLNLRKSNKFCHEDLYDSTGRCLPSKVLLHSSLKAMLDERMLRQRGPSVEFGEHLRRVKSAVCG